MTKREFINWLEEIDVPDNTPVVTWSVEYQNYREIDGALFFDSKKLEIVGAPKAKMEPHAQLNVIQIELLNSCYKEGL